MALNKEETVAQLQSAAKGFDHLFSNRLPEAREVLSSEDTPFHLMGLGVCSFLVAALGMETDLMGAAVASLNAAEAGAKKQLKASQKSGKSVTRFQPGMEWEVLHADTVILSGMTNVLSESYMGYIQCLYALNSAHSKFTKLYKSVFPDGLEGQATPSVSRAPSRKPSTASLAPSASSTTPSISPTRPGFFGRWGNSSLTVPRATTPTPVVDDGPVEELIISGVAFGFGLFNLVFSLLPAGAKRVVGWLGFNYDRRLALRALAVSAAKNDVHAVFAGLSLMTYHGVVLLLAGYQADEQHILKQYRDIVDRIDSKYPTGSLWILNRAKILRMSYQTDAAIEVLQEGLTSDRPNQFVQADALLVFELAWTLLSQRRYEEAAETFIRMTQLNHWSHATYYWLAAGCWISLKNYTKAQELLDQVPALLERKKIGGKDLPSEVLIRKRITFYKEKQKRRGGPEKEYARAIIISPAEEMGLFWNTHQRISKPIAEGHIREWLSYTPHVQISLPYAVENPSTVTSPVDLDTQDELALRSLLLGIVLRTVGDFGNARSLLSEALAAQPKLAASTWIGGIASFESAVNDLKEAQAGEEEAKEEAKKRWEPVLKGASEKLDRALALAPNSVDLSSRLESRVAMLRDEIALKREKLDAL